MKWVYADGRSSIRCRSMSATTVELPSMDSTIAKSRPLDILSDEERMLKDAGTYSFRLTL